MPMLVAGSRVCVSVPQEPAQRKRRERQDFVVIALARVLVVVKAKAWKRNWDAVSSRRSRPWTRVAGKGKPDANIKSKDGLQEQGQ